MKILTLIVLFLSLFASAQQTSHVFSKDQLDQFAAEYLQQQEIDSTVQLFSQLSAVPQGFTTRDCGGEGGGQVSCIDASCSRLPSYECDDHSDITQISNFCRGVDGACIEAACSRMPSYQCDDKSDIKKVASYCRNVFDGECVSAVCDKMPSYLCDDHSDLKKVSNICSGRVDAGCISAVCSRLPSYQCDDISDLKKVAKSCSGQ